MHKAGFVNIIGNPNVGKSTLMNALVGEKISIITSKAQTTRHRIMGIVSGENFQIIYSDTPGILNPKYKLQKSMMNFVDDAVSDADIFLVVIDVKADDSPEEKILQRIIKSNAAAIVILNKCDLVNHEKQLALALKWSKIIPKAEIIPVSALKKHKINIVFDVIMKYLPVHPAYFDKEQLTDKNDRFIMSEIIREKIFTHYDKEIPYACEVIVEAFKDENKIIRIAANILVERETQKAIIIGHKGSSLKKIGTAARLDAEEFFGKKIFLELFVKVDKDWRNSDRELKRFGYSG
jgi:GTP-binding protein Era